MYLKTDSLGHHEILDDSQVRSGEDSPMPLTYLTVSEYNHFLDLTRSFDKSYNESVATGNAFKNPLTNKDTAWLYLMASKENAPQGTVTRILKEFPGPGEVQKVVTRFMKYMDDCFKTLRQKKITILGRRT
jgi:hypothetical protein